MRRAAGFGVGLLSLFLVLYGLFSVACDGGSSTSHERSAWLPRLPYDYAIVLDAGSSGTRMHVYHIPPEGGLVKSVGKRTVEPGLSFFADDPRGALQYLRPLFTDAAKLISAYPLCEEGCH